MAIFSTSDQGWLMSAMIWFRRHSCHMNLNNLLPKVHTKVSIADWSNISFSSNATSSWMIIGFCYFVLETWLGGRQEDKNNGDKNMLSQKRSESLTLSAKKKNKWRKIEIRLNDINNTANTVTECDNNNDVVTPMMKKEQSPSLTFPLSAPSSVPSFNNPISESSPWEKKLQTKTKKKMMKSSNYGTSIWFLQTKSKVYVATCTDV